MEKHNLILDKTFQFSLMIIELCNVLDERKKFAISNQLLRSATSIGANVREAQNAESQPDFIHKLKIAAKEAEEAASMSAETPAVEEEAPAAEAPAEA